MKKRYSEYVGYEYNWSEEWFNPHVEWDTLLFVDPMLLKKTNIKEFIGSYDKIVDYFSTAIVKLESKLPQRLKEKMVCFDEVKEANLGFSYDSNEGSGLTGKTSLNVLTNLKKFVKSGLFEIEDFVDIALFDKNVSGDRITDMIINILKNEFIEYSCRIAVENSFPIKKIMLKQGFNFNEMRWEYGMTDIPYIVNENGVEVPVLLLPKEFLVTGLYNEVDNFITWLYHNEKDYLKETFDYNLKEDLMSNKDKIINDIIDNNKDDILKRFNADIEDLKPYDLNEDKEKVNNIYEMANEFYKENYNFLLEKSDNNASLSVKEVAELLINYLQHVVTNKKGYILLILRGNQLIAEPKISKFVHVLFDARIKDAGFNVDISPETNAGYGPIDFKISRGDDKVLIENKISSNPKLLDCIDEDKQIHTYLKQEDCKNAYLVVFINKESDVDKINELNRKALKYNNSYNIFVKDVDCIKRESASHR